MLACNGPTNANPEKQVAVRPLKRQTNGSIAGLSAATAQHLAKARNRTTEGRQCRRKSPKRAKLQLAL
jgi:hypothetical protein